MWIINPVFKTATGCRIDLVPTIDVPTQLESPVVKTRASV